jgi:two-component system cell cycle sensor histidine kinase/response regulator CckA
MTMAEGNIVDSMTAERLELLRETSAAQARLLELLGNITAQDSVPEICRTVVEGVRKYFGFERAGLFLWDEEKRKFVGTYGTDLDGQTRDETGIYLGEEDGPGGPADRIIAGSVIERGCRLGQPAARPGEENVKADLLGLRARGRLYGVLSVDNRISRRPISERDLQYISLMSHVLGNALESVRTHTALLQSEERFRQVAENSGEWIWEVNPEGRYTYSSPVIRSILGYEPQDVMELRMLDLVAEEDRQHMADVLHRAFLEKASIRLVIHTQQHKDGHKVILETSGLPMVDATGRLIGYRGAHRDITRETELEAQLRHSQKMEVIGRLAGGIAHDFNNLLTSIIGCSSLLLEEMDENNSARADVELIKASGERAAALTRQLQAFSKRHVLKMESLIVNDIVRDMEKILRRTLGEDIELVAELDPHIEPVIADAGQLEQIIMHLAVNAREAMIDSQASFRALQLAGSPGKSVGPNQQAKRLVIRTSQRELDERFCRHNAQFTPGGYVVLTVSDSGTGMTTEIKEHLFEPFFTTKGVGRGSGLGLSTIYGIIKQLGGAIQVQSKPGHGTTFDIFLKQATFQETLRQVEPQAPIQKGKEIILVVEDEESVRRLIVRILQSYGYTTLEASHGGEGLRICSAHEGRIDLIITDMIMPQVSGKQFIEQLRKSRTDFKVLFVSGYSADDTVDGEVVGVDTPLIQKPFTRESLARKVREVLDAS